MTDLQINAGFDGGNIRVIRVDGDTVDLEIATDSQSDFFQWFSFRIAGARGRTLTFPPPQRRAVGLSVRLARVQDADEHRPQRLADDRDQL